MKINSNKISKFQFQKNAENRKLWPKMSIHFVGKKSRITRHRLLPIYLRVTIEKRRFEVATHRHVEPYLWSASGGRVKGKSDDAFETNMALDEIRKKVYDYKERILSQNRGANC